MRSSSDIAKSVINRRNEHIEKVNARRKTMIKTASGICSCLALAVIVTALFLTSNKNTQNKKQTYGIDIYESKTDIPEIKDAVQPDNVTSDFGKTTEKESETESNTTEPIPETTFSEYVVPKAPDTTQIPADTTPVNETKPDESTQNPDNIQEGEHNNELIVKKQTSKLTARTDVVIYSALDNNDAHSPTEGDPFCSIDPQPKYSCGVHRNPFFHSVPLFFFDDDLDMYTYLVEYYFPKRYNCVSDVNIMSFIKHFNISDEKITKWYYEYGGYYIYNIPFEILISRDEVAFADYYTENAGNELMPRLKRMNKLLGEEEMKKVMLESLSHSNRENDKAAYKKLTDNGGNLTACNFSIADFIFESDYTVSDVSVFIEEYKKANTDTRSLFDYDLSIIDEENKTVKGQSESMHPCEVDELLHK